MPNYLIRTINSRLWIKLMIPVSLVVFLVVASSLWYNISSQNRLCRDQMSNQNWLLGQTVEGSMFDALAIGDNDTVRAQFKRLSEKTQNMKIYVYDFNSTVSFSTEADSIGQPVTQSLEKESGDDVLAMLKSGKSSEKVLPVMVKEEEFSVINMPIMNEPKCFHCHGQARKVLGGISVMSSVEATKGAIRHQQRVSIGIGIIGLLAIIAIIALFFYHFVGKKLRLVLDATSRLREKDFTHEVDVKRGDELNYILARISLVTGELRQTMKRVVEGSDSIYGSASDLKTIADDLSLSSSQASEKAVTVSAAAEEMSVNNTTIAEAMEESTSSMNGISTAVEQMSSTVQEIAKNTAESKQVTEKASSEFSVMLQEVNQLGTRASDLDAVTDEIRAISDQVSMLALNARIEAARAGEAGKGFAVVAQEITELAAETNQSTLEADEKLQWIKDTSGRLTEQVTGLTGFIKDSDAAVNSIAAAVEEQNVATQEIAANINEVTLRITQVNDNVNQGAQAASDIAKDISQVEQGAGQVNESSQKVDENAHQLSAMAEEFKAMMAEFKI